MAEELWQLFLYLFPQKWHGVGGIPIAHFHVAD